MTLPASRNTTYTVGSQVKSADLDAIQDCLVDLNNLLTGQAQSTWPTVTFFDAFGLPLAPLTNWDENWRINAAPSSTDTTTTDGSTDPEGWFADCGSSGTRAYLPPTASFPNRYVELEASAGDDVDLTSEYIAFAHADVLFAWEWTAQTGDIVGSSDAAFMVLQTETSGYTVGFNTFGVSGNWRAVVGAGSSVDQDTGVAIADDTAYRFRIEILGDNRHAGSNFLINWYINGVLVHSTTNAFEASAMRFWFELSVGSGGPFQLRIGRMRAAWNY